MLQPVYITSINIPQAKMVLRILQYTGKDRLALAYANTKHRRTVISPLPRNPLAR